MRITALVVTYNRLELLKENIGLLLDIQKKGLIQNIIVVDNNSDIDTKSFLENLSNIHYVRLNKNLGGAGGFNAGIKYFYKELNDDAIWIMDDDTMPNSDTVSELRSVADVHKNFGFLLSNALWTDNTPCKMNIPMPNLHKWTDNFKDKTVVVPLLRGSFVSMLISRKAVKLVGYPITDFFVWGDDVNYSERISRHLDGYFVPSSIVIHKMKNNVSTDIVKDDSTRVSRYYYAFRNDFYNARKRSFRDGAKFFVHSLVEITRVLKSSKSLKFKRVSIILKGVFAGIVFNPSIEEVED